MINNRKNDGFTLIELMLSLTFISFILLFMVAAILQLTRLYVKGSAIRQINQTGRQVIEDVAASIRTGTEPTVTHKRLCVGNTTYAWNVEGDTVEINKFDDAIGTAVRFVSVQDSGGTLCNDINKNIPKTGSEDLIGPGITTLKFTAKPQGKLWTISLVLSTAGSNIADNIGTEESPKFECAGDNHFCAFGDFNTNVYARKGE